jgi:hypothetical protein
LIRTALLSLSVAVLSALAVAVSARLEFALSGAIATVVGGIAILCGSISFLLVLVDLIVPLSRLLPRGRYGDSAQSGESEQ